MTIVVEVLLVRDDAVQMRIRYWVSTTGAARVPLIVMGVAVVAVAVLAAVSV
jgi:hypothetical protein